ncbi:unnamed protein product [Rotaria sordida]|uniref:Uncharacterized protein n=1 Tax=Rotaria sordida TaxID=392033 RepID=A0A819J2Y5_9BILA|nr:unnamed protein product [Rotaria sordida]CAF4174424.1 unnamed protein product [Rotaria sordida]
MIQNLSINQIYHSLRILDTETSCDDTAAAVVDGQRTILIPIVAEIMKDIEWNSTHEMKLHEHPLVQDMTGGVVIG